MNATVADLVAYLLTLDQTTKAEVVVHSNGTGYYDQGGTARTAPFSPELTEHYSYKDTKTLLLGRYND